MTEKDNWIKGLIISVILAIILQTGLSVGLAINSKDIKDNEKLLVFISKDYVPSWFLEGMIQNMNYQTEEIVAVLTNDQQKIKEINIKYLDFQKFMLNNLAKQRGGISMVTRGMNVQIIGDTIK